MTNQGYRLVMQISSGRWRQLNTALLILAIINGFMTFRGLVLGAVDGQPGVIDIGTMALLAVAVTVFQFVGWSAAYRLVPAQDGGAALGYSAAVLVLFMILCVGVSTVSNAVALAGSRAVVHAMHHDVQGFEDRVAALGVSANRFAPLAEEFERAAGYWNGRASAERGSGSSSGGSGEGTVTYALQDIADRFATLAKTAQALAVREADVLGTAQAALKEARAVLDQPGTIEARRTAMKAALDRIRQALLVLSDGAPADGLLRDLSTIPLEARNRPLTARTEAGRRDQRLALDRLQTELNDRSAASLALLQTIATRSPPDLPVVVILTPVEAVIAHWRAFLPAWAAALGLDLLPVVILLWCFAPMVFLTAEERALGAQGATTVDELQAAQDSLAALASKERDRNLTADLRARRRGRRLRQDDPAPDNKKDPSAKHLLAGHEAPRKGRRGKPGRAGPGGGA